MQILTPCFHKQIDLTYYDFATGKVIPKPKYVRPSTREKTEQAPKASPGKRLKATAKGAKSGKKKMHAHRLETLSEMALFEADQMRLIKKRSNTNYHISHASGKKDDDDEVSMSKDDDDNADDEDNDEQDDDKEQTESDNDGDDFVHPKFSTHDEEDKDEEWIVQRVRTPSHYESSDDEAYDEVTQGGNVEKEKMDEEKTNE
ncbi:hypothetical protein Tco_0348679 [Tanacetum coccineum]